MIYEIRGLRLKNLAKDVKKSLAGGKNRCMSLA
jgi:hypothetical protein